MKKVVEYNKDKSILFTGTEEECIKYIMSQASEHIKISDKRIIYRVIEDSEGDVYDVGRATLYQILDLEESK